ncbi:hypothetical protein [Massilia sp. H6]|uniref:hypothetical protein n=1 Tax=Massilia sp. H6 TaxID=2970464 RepID=UPI00216A7CC4|nr:hypothetical protein [Massilia sp. H6]UVW30600.1 hypothetical protein NRS07_19165 [Massilia sp. H6]
MQPERPSNVHPDLTDERLQALATFFANTRSSVASLHDPFAGDDAWALGCRSFARWRNLLVGKIQSGEWPWFKVLDPSMHFIFGIGDVPVRFYRGTVKRPPSRTLAQSAQELTQLSLAFPMDKAQHRELYWRFAIETDFLGEPSKVVFAALAKEDGAAIYHWEIQFEKVDVDVKLDVRDEDMIELPPPAVVVPLVKKKATPNE